MNKYFIMYLTMMGLVVSTAAQKYEVRVIEEKPIDPYANYIERMNQINRESEERRRRQTEEHFLNESLEIQRERLRLDEERMRYIKYGF